MPGWAKNKKDANHKSIVQMLRQCGCGVLDLGRVGGKGPDILVSRPGVYQNWLFEIKKEGHKQTKGTGELARHEAAQVKWHDDWPGQSAIITSFEEAWLIIIA
jgi:hypothetical protein